MPRLIHLAVAALLLVPSVDAFSQSQAPRSIEEVRLSFAPLVKKTAPAVVNIYTSKKVRERRVSPLFDDPFFRRFFGAPPNAEQGRERVQNALGSGVIVAKDGLIVTNYHVIEGADEIRVVLADRREFSAEVVATEERNDLALLRVDTEGAELPNMPLGNSDELEVGDLILAIGNPFGVGQTVTSGIISANARSTRAIGEGGVFIQTDAAINPGNSGGALIGLDGELVGVNTAIFSRSGGSLGIGFAIPVNLVRRMILDHERTTQVARPWLGGTGESVRQDVAKALGLDRPRGVILSTLHPLSPLKRAGLEANDIVLSVEGQAVDDPFAMRYRFETALNDTVAVEYWRRGVIATVDVKVEPPPEIPARDQTAIGGNSPFNGVRIVNISPAVIQEANLKGVVDGVMIDGVRRNSVAGRLGFRPGDVIEEVNGNPIKQVGDLQKVQRDQPNSWRIFLRRDGKRLRMEFRA